MKVYSDTLTRSDLLDALPRGVVIEHLSTISRPRVRSYGWNVRLGRPSSRRHFNTGQWGAGDYGAASYDDHGAWMVRLFAIDPDARLAHWDGVDDFNTGTNGVYSEEL